MSRPVRCATLFLVLAMPTLAAGVPSAASAAPRCPRSPEQTRVTWTTAGGEGVGLPVRTTSRRDPLTWEYAPDGALLSGLAVAGRAGVLTDAKHLAVVVARDPGGRGRAAVCAGRERVATLPALGRGEIVASAAVNGRRVAWRTIRSSGRGRVSVAAVRHGRAVRVRTTRPLASTDHGVSGAIHLLPSGTVAWAAGRPAARRGWVWPAGGSPIRIRRWSPASPDVAASIRILDARHVLVDGVVRAYRSPVPGRCSDVVGSATTDLGGWRLSPIDDGTLDDGQDLSSSRTALVCDPAAGSYLDVVPYGSEEGSTVGEPGSGSVVDLHRAGDWLLSTRTPVGEYAAGGPTTNGRNVRTGERFQADGFVEIAGQPHPAEGARRGIDTSGPGWVTGATAGPGVLAWCAGPTPGASTATVWVWDARGTRAVAETTRSPTAADPATRTCGLGLDGTVLRWGPADAPQRLALEPASTTGLG